MSDNPPIQQGNIYWIAPDASRGSVPGYPHPHVVIQDDLFNQSRVHSVIVCALSSQLKRANEPGNLLLQPGEGNLEKQSVIVVSQLSAVSKSDLGDYIGALSPQRVTQILDGIRFQQRAFFNR